uniref:Uncharacterized protein n=1 Tax=Rhizophora mucronata TaxID=61149 RepID=A0A2P2LA23_RHIMU
MKRNQSGKRWKLCYLGGRMMKLTSCSIEIQNNNFSISRRLLFSMFF